MNTTTETTQVTQPSTNADVPALASNASLKDVIATVNSLVAKVNAKRDRGPESTREMTEEDARRVISGDLKGLKHGKAAEAIGLSYGQVYSARLGFTFKAVSKATPWVPVK